MAERQCTKTACARPAVASCAYNYAARLVWIGELTPERDPSCYDLCEEHASRMRVMQGWTLDDRRAQRAEQVALLLP